MVRLVSRKEFNKARGLCIDCANAYPRKCEFIRLKDCDKGLELVGAEAVATLVVDSLCGRYKYLIYKVTSCPDFISDTEFRLVFGDGSRFALAR
ncbi:MAG: hypothetical protein ACPLRU_01155 [Desulfofundulus sp.]